MLHHIHRPCYGVFFKFIIVKKKKKKKKRKTNENEWEKRVDGVAGRGWQTTGTR